jgi:CheY-like chemotaxis protein
VAERILIITDVETDGHLVSNSLQNLGFETRMRAGNARAIDAIDTERVGLVVLDTRTQEVEAAQLCKLARRSPRGAVVPILFMGTGKESIKTSADAIAHGADLLFLVDTELHQLVRKCIHYLGEPVVATDPPLDHARIDPIRAESMPTTDRASSDNSDWSELDRLMVSDSHQTLGELGPAKPTNPDLDLLVSRLAPELELPRYTEPAQAEVSAPLKGQSAQPPKAGLKVGHAVDLNERGLGTVLFTAQKLELRGRIEIASNGVLRRIFFDDGSAVYIDSSAPNEDLVASLVQEGLLTDQQLETARQQGRELNLSPEEVLIDTNQVSPQDIQQSLQTHVERRLIELFSLESGESVVIQGGPRPIDPVVLENPLSRLILDGVRRKYGRLRLYRVFGTGSLVPKRSTLNQLTCKLTTTEEAVLNRIDGKTTINGLARATGLGETECLALVYGLSILMLVDVPTLARTPGGALALPSSQYAFANPPRTNDALPGFAELVSRKHREVLYADYYSILGIGRDSNRAEIEAAFNQLQSQFDPNRVREDSPLRRAVEEIAQVLQDAYGILMKDAWRSRYEQAIDISTPSP